MMKTHLKKAIVGAAVALTVGGGMLATAVPAEAGYRGYRHGYHGGYHYRHHRGNGAAVAAGLIGGLALGAIASNAYSYGYPGYRYAPAYGYGYAPVTYGYAPAAYGYAPATYGYGGCVVERRVRVNRFGERVVRDVQICR